MTLSATERSQPTLIRQFVELASWLRAEGIVVTRDGAGSFAAGVPQVRGRRRLSRPPVTARMPDRAERHEPHPLSPAVAAPLVP